MLIDTPFEPETNEQIRKKSDEAFKYFRELEKEHHKMTYKEFSKNNPGNRAIFETAEDYYKKMTT